ncbi:MAG: NrfD/PsrC family molybdoenzyme membrane anchor subunit [Dehalococcoidia bacterium]
MISPLRFGQATQDVWDWRAAGNFCLGGTGSGLLALAVACLPAGASSPILVVGAALSLVGAGLFLVWLEIGRPTRFLHVYFNPWTSWMTREAFMAGVLFVLALLALTLDSAGLLLLAGLAGALFLYCQGRILRASKGIPAWREPAIVPLIFVTGIASGAGLLLLLSPSNDGLPALFVAAVLGLRQLTLSHYLRQLAHHHAPSKTLSVLRTANSWSLVAGTLIPTALLGLSLYLPAASSALAGAAGLLAVFTGWMMTYSIVVRASQYQGFAIPRRRR